MTDEKNFLDTMSTVLVLLVEFKVVCQYTCIHITQKELDFNSTMLIPFVENTLQLYIGRSNDLHIKRPGKKSKTKEMKKKTPNHQTVSKRKRFTLKRKRRKFR